MYAVKPRGSSPPLPGQPVARQLHLVPDGVRPQVVAPALSRWAQYEAIGLGPVSVRRTRAANALVAVYRVLGFVVLAVIVVVLLGYLALTAFYLVNRTWVVPTVISATDEHALALEAELADHQLQRDRVAAELADADRAVVAEQQFERDFLAAIKSDLAVRQAALARVRTLARGAASTRHQIHATNHAFAAQQSERIAREFRAGLVDRAHMLDGKYQLAQISSSSLSLAEKQADLDTRAAELATAVAGLTTLAAEQPSSKALSYDVLTIKRSYDASKLALAKARDTRTMLEDSLRRYDRLIENLVASNYLRALRDHATVAVVPYDNLDAVRVGAPLYACRFGVVACQRVGIVKALLPGEVMLRHPHRERQLRGRMIELALDNDAAARDDVLFAGGAPLWL